MTIKVGEYRSKKFYNLGAKLADVEVLLNELSKVTGRSDKDIEHLEIARRYAMKVSAHVLRDVKLELNFEHLERLHADPEWQKVETESIRAVIDEFEERKDAEFHKSCDKVDESAQR